MARVVQMLLVHDLVEIDAGDTFVYDPAGQTDKAARERAAATRLFGTLPADQGAGLAALWEEFEARQTPDARFAASLDRLLPVLHNLWCEGKSWQEHGIRLSQVIEVNHHMADGAPALWTHVRPLIEDAAERGLLARGVTRQRRAGCVRGRPGQSRSVRRSRPTVAPRAPRKRPSTHPSSPWCCSGTTSTRSPEITYPLRRWGGVVPTMWK